MASIQQPVSAPVANPMQLGEARRAAEQDRVHRERQKQALRLQRENILSQRTSNPSRRAALESALAQIEGQLERLG